MPIENSRLARMAAGVVRDGRPKANSGRGAAQSIVKTRGKYYKAYKQDRTDDRAATARDNATINRENPGFSDRLLMFHRSRPGLDKALTVAGLLGFSALVGAVSFGLSWVICHATKRKNDALAWMIGGTVAVITLATHTVKVFGLNRRLQMKFNLRLHRLDNADPASVGLNVGMHNAGPLTMAVIANARNHKGGSLLDIKIVPDDIRKFINYATKNGFTREQFAKSVHEYDPINRPYTDARVDGKGRVLPKVVFRASADNRNLGIKEGRLYCANADGVGAQLDHDEKVGMYLDSAGTPESLPTMINAKNLESLKKQFGANVSVPTRSGIRLDELRAINFIHADGKPPSLYRLAVVIRDGLGALGDTADNEKVATNLGSTMMGPIALTLAATGATALVAGVSSTNTSAPLPANVKDPGKPAVPALIENPQALSTYDKSALSVPVTQSRPLAAKSVPQSAQSPTQLVYANGGYSSQGSPNALSQANGMVA